MPRIGRGCPVAEPGGHRLEEAGDSRAWTGSSTHRPAAPGRQVNEIARPLDRAGGAARPRPAGQVLAHVALEVEDPDDRPRPARLRRREARSTTVGEMLAVLRRLEAAHGLAEAARTLATCSASAVVGRGLDDGRRHPDRSDDLKIPDPTKTASAPSCITSAASDGRGNAADAGQRDAGLQQGAISCTRLIGTPVFVAGPSSSALVKDLSSGRR